MKLAYNPVQHAYWLDGRRCSAVSSVAKRVQDSFALDLYRQRMVAMGLVVRPDLARLIDGYMSDIDGNKQLINAACDDASEAARSSVAANEGTAVHSAIEAWLSTGRRPLDPQLCAAVDTCIDLLAEHKLEVVESEVMVAWPKTYIAGRFDLVVRDGAGVLHTADIKTGAKAVDYPHSIAAQMGLYDFAPRWFDDDGNERERLYTSGDCYVLHIVDGVGELHVIDRETCKESAALATTLHRWVKRDARDIITKVPIPTRETNNA